MTRSGKSLSKGIWPGLIMVYSAIDKNSSGSWVGRPKEFTIPKDKVLETDWQSWYHALRRHALVTEVVFWFRLGLPLKTKVSQQFSHNEGLVLCMRSNPAAPPGPEWIFFQDVVH